MACNSVLPGQDFPSSAPDSKSPADILLRRLPALPAVSTRLLGMMGRSDINLKEISSLISSDAALAAEILRMSNSAMFSARSEVRSILQALAVLGTQRVKGLACTVALRSYLGNILQLPPLKRCWRHNLATAVVSSEIADWARLDGGEAYTAGILHDIGRLALIASDPSKYLQVLDGVANEGGCLCVREEETYGLDHAVAGEWLAARWGLPPFIRRAIRDHHRPLRPGCDETTGTVNYACRIADVLGFSAVDAAPHETDPVQEFLGVLPGTQRERLHLNIAELQILIASRVNALEA